MMTIIDLIAQHGWMLCVGVTLVMGMGCVWATLLSEPVARQRCCEASVLCTLVWMAVAIVPLPRFSIPAREANQRDVSSRPMNKFTVDTRREPWETNERGSVKLSKVEALTQTKAPVPLTAEGIDDAGELRNASGVNKVLSDRPEVSAIVTSMDLPARPVRAILPAVYLTIAGWMCCWLLLGRVLLWWIVAAGQRLDASSPLLRAVRIVEPGDSGGTTDMSGVTRWTRLYTRNWPFRSRISVFQSPRCAGPFAFGLLRPTIVLPGNDGGKEVRPAIVQALRHELAHAERHDAWGRALMNLAFPLIGLHPFYWWLRRNATFAAELIADDMAAALTSRERYSGDLIVLIRQQTQLQRFVLSTTSIASTRSQFYRRIEHLLCRVQPLRRTCSPGMCLSLTAGFTLLLLIAIGLIGAPLVATVDAGTGENQSQGSEAARKSVSDEGTAPWYLNNVLSTSLETPAAMLRVPLEETVEARGTIFDADGSPTAGAEVWGASVFSEPPLRERVLTDAGGHFVLHLKPLTGESEHWSLSAFKGSKGAKIEGELNWIKQLNPKQPAPLTARLVERGMMICRVLEQETGKPIRDARLFLGDGRVFISDTNGKIEIGGLQLGNYRSVLLAEGRDRRRVVFDNTLRPDGKLNIYLRKAGRITGTVVDQDGRPLPYAWINVPSSGTAMALDGRCSLADAEGRFVWEGVAYDRMLRSIYAGHAGYQSEEIRELTVTTDRPTEINFRLKKHSDAETTAMKSQPQQPGQPVSLERRDITGTIIGPDGRPVAGATVRWGATDYEDVRRELKSDASGEFLLRQVPDRDGYITVIDDAFAPRFAKVDKGQTKIKVLLETGSTVGGRVVTKTGLPIAGVYIVPVIASPDPSLCNPLWISQRTTHSNEDGRFEITGLPKTHVLFDFLHDRMNELRNRALQTDKTDHVVELASRGAFRGRVLDSVGNPVKDFRVMIDFPRRRQPGDSLSSGFDVEVRDIGVSYTDDDGRFAFGNEISPNSIYRVTVAGEGYGDAVNDRVISTTIDQLELAEEYVFTMQQPHKISVRVWDASEVDGGSDSDRPVSGATVTLVNDDPRLDNVLFSWGSDEIGDPNRKTNLEGFARFEQLSNGEGTVVVQAAGYARQRFGWRGGEPAFTVRLVPESSIAGNVRATGGTPMHGLYLSLESVDEQRNWDSLEQMDDGKFKFSMLPGGWYTLSLRDERRELFQQQFLLKPGEHLNLAVTVDPVSAIATVAEESRTGMPLPPHVEATVNGRNLTKLTFAEGLARFKDEYIGYARGPQVQPITEQQLRDAIRRAAAHDTRQAAAGAIAEQNRHYVEHAAPALLRLANGNEWPLGTKLSDNNVHRAESALDLWLSIPLPGASPKSHYQQLELRP